MAFDELERICYIYPYICIQRVLYPHPYLSFLFDLLLQSGSLVKLIGYVTACTDLGFYLAAGLVCM